MRTMLSIIVLLSLLSLSTVFAQTEQVLVESDFEKPAVPPTIGVNGEWEIVDEASGNGILQGTGVDWNDYIYFPDGNNWADYAFEFDLNITSGSVYIDARVGESSCDAYEVLIAPDDTYINLMTIASGDGDTCDTLNTMDENDNFSFVTGTWTKVRLEVVGDEVKFFINNKLQLEGSDDTYSTGQPRITVSPGGQAAIDNLVVTNLGEAIASTGNTGSTTTTNTSPTATPSLPTNTKPTPGAVSNNTAVSLTNYAGTYQQAVAELEQNGLIPAGGELLFTEDYAFFTGVGYWYTPLAARSPRTDVVMAGELTYTVGGTAEYEECSLLARVVTEGTSAVESISAALTNEGGALIWDDFGGQEDVNDYYQLLDLDYSQSHHVLMILQGSSATLFVDGELVFDQVQVDPRSGTFGISLIGTARGARCEGRNIWVYSLD